MPRSTLYVYKPKIKLQDTQHLTRSMRLLWCISIEMRKKIIANIFKGLIKIPIISLIF